mgnify:FL=1
MNKLYDLRKKHNLSQTELGEVFGISQSVINRMELGTRPIRGNELKMFADFFGVTTDYLLGNDAAPPLPAGESRLLELFRALPEAGKQALLMVATQMQPAK